MHGFKQFQPFVKKQKLILRTSKFKNNRKNRKLLKSKKLFYKKYSKITSKSYEIQQPSYGNKKLHPNYVKYLNDRAQIQSFTKVIERVKPVRRRKKKRIPKNKRAFMKLRVGILKKEAQYRHILLKNPLSKFLFKSLKKSQLRRVFRRRFFRRSFFDFTNEHHRRRYHKTRIKWRFDKFRFKNKLRKIKNFFFKQTKPSQSLRSLKLIEHININKEKKKKKNLSII